MAIEPVCHVSPDGRLRFLITVDPDGDVTLGFEGYPWHTHADILAGSSGLSQAEAVRRSISHLIENRSVIALLSVSGRVVDAWTSDNPVGDARNVREDESLELCYWGGRAWDEFADRQSKQGH